MAQNQYDIYSDEAIAARLSKQDPAVAKPTVKAPAAPAAQPQAAEPGLIDKFLKFFETPLTRQNDTTAQAINHLTVGPDDVTPTSYSGGKTQGNPMGMAHGGEHNVNPLDPTSLWRATKPYIAGAIEGASTPSTIAQAATVSGGGGVLRAGQAARSAGLTTGKAIKQAPEFVKAVKEMSTLAGNPLAIAGNAALGVQGANTALDEEASTFERVVGGIGAAGGFGAAGAGYLSRGPKTPPKIGGVDFRSMKTPTGEPLHTPPPSGLKVTASDMENSSKLRGRKAPSGLPGIKETLETELGQLDDPTTRLSKSKDLSFEDTRLEQDRLKEALANDLPADQSLKEVVKGKVDTEKAQNKYVMDNAQHEAKNLKDAATFEKNRVRDYSKLFDEADKKRTTGIQSEARELQARDDAAEEFSAGMDEEIAEKAARTRAADMRDELESKGRSISETSKTVGPDGVTVTATERFGEKNPDAPPTAPTDKPAKPEPPKGPILGDGVVPTKKPRRRAFFPNKKDAMAQAMNEGGSTNVRFHEATGLWEVFDDPNIRVKPHTVVKEGDPIVDVIIPPEDPNAALKAKLRAANEGGQPDNIVSPRPEAPMPPATGKKIIDPPEEPPPTSPLPVKKKGPKGPKGGGSSGGALKVAKESVSGATNEHTPEEWAEFDKIVAEMENEPFQPRTWNEDGSPDVEIKSGNLSGRGNRSKVVERPFKPGNGGAAVYNDLVQVDGTNASRGDVINGLKKFREGKKSVWGARGMQIAKDRLNKARAFAAEAPEDPKLVSEPVDAMDSTIDGLISAAQQGGYKGDPAQLKAVLKAQLDGLDPSFGKVLQESGPTWWENLDSLPEPKAEPIVDKLDTGEAQPRLPGANAARQVGQAETKFELPVTSNADFGLDGGASEAVKAAEAAAEKAKSPSMFDDMLDEVPETPTSSGSIPVKLMQQVMGQTPGTRYAALRDMAKAAPIERGGRGTPMNNKVRELGRELQASKKARVSFEAPKAPEVPPTVEPPAVSQEATQDVADLESLSPELRKKAIAEMIKRENNGERGAVTTELGTRTGLAIAGGMGGHAYGASDEEDSIDPMTGAAIGATAGFVGPDVARKLIHIAQQSGSDDATATAYQSVKDTISKYAKVLPDYYRFALLANIPNLPINALVGPYGSAVMKALEYTVANDPRGLKALGKLIRVDKFMKNWWLADEQANSMIEMAQSRGESSEAIEQLPPLVRKILSWPGNAMTRGDIAARDMLMDAHFDLGEARSATLTDEPELATLKGVRAFSQGSETEGGKRGIVSKMLLPFHKTLINQLEGGLERTPVFGIIAQLSKDKPEPVNHIIAQQLLGGGVIYGSFKAGVATPYDKMETPILTKVISNAGGQYGTIAAAAFLAGQAYGAGDQEALMRFVTEIIDSTALPTTRSLKDIAKTGWKGLKIAAGQEPMPTLDEMRQNATSGAIPQILKYEDVKEKSDTIENMIKRLYQTPNDNVDSLLDGPLTTLLDDQPQ